MSLPRHSGPSGPADVEQGAGSLIPPYWHWFAALGVVLLLSAFALVSPAHADPLPDKGFDLDTTDWQPAGISSDGTTMWVADALEGEVLAYNMSAGVRDPSKDIALDTTIHGPSGIWADGGLMWVVDVPTKRVYVYSLVTQLRVEGLEFNLDEDNERPRGIWSDGRTLWVIDALDLKLYAYGLANGERQPCKEFVLDPVGTSPRDLWSDGTTVWVSDVFKDRLYAYALTGGMRLPSRDYELLAENRTPTGIWSDGATMWVAEAGHHLWITGVTGDKLYAYDVTDVLTAPAAGVVIYHDPSAGAAEVRRYHEARALLAGARIPYTEVTGAVHDDAARLAGLSNSVMPRFFLGDPTAAGWVPQPKSNNGGLRWLRHKITELSCN